MLSLESINYLGFFLKALKNLLIQKASEFSFKTGSNLICLFRHKITTGDKIVEKYKRKISLNISQINKKVQSTSIFLYFLIFLPTYIYGNFLAQFRVTSNVKINITFVINVT